MDYDSAASDVNEAHEALLKEVSEAVTYFIDSKKDPSLPWLMSS